MPNRSKGIPISELEHLRARLHDLEIEVAAARLADQRRAVDEGHYRALFDGIDAGFCVVELAFDDAGRPVDYRFLEVNPAFSRYTGLDSATGRWMRELAPNHEQHWFDIYGQVAVSGEPQRFEHEAHSLNRWYDVHALALGADKPYRVAVLFTDISRRRQAENDLRILNASLESLVESRTKALSASEAQLRQAQKMEAVGQLTGGIAHDFNNLLTGIGGSLELLQARLAQGSLTDLERYILSAQGATKRAAALTHRLLAFSRRQTLDPKAIDINRLVDSMCDMIRRAVGPAVELEIVDQSELWHVFADFNQLENALLNLCINARDAMPGGGVLRVQTSNQSLDARAAEVLGLAPGDYVSLSVTDHGTGMPEHVLTRAFEPFFTTKPIGVGTGLGLSMVYGFTRQSGGEVRLESRPGEGTTVALYFPRHVDSVDTQACESACSSAGVRVADKTVLIVDDEPTVRMLVVEVLEDLGCSTLEAADGSAGLAILQSDARIDLLISDVGLPGGINGRQMADAARVMRPELKVLFITGYAESTVVGQEQFDAGMHVLTKPFSMETLAIRVQELTSALAV